MEEIAAFLQEIPVDVILFCFSLPLEDTLRRYEKGRRRRIACQIRTSCRCRCRTELSGTGLKALICGGGGENGPSLFGVTQKDT